MNKYLIFRKLKISLFLISLFSCYRVAAQSSASEKNFISPVPISLNLTKGKFKEVSEKVQNNPTYKEMRFVKVGRLDKIQKEGELLINIPDREVGIIAKANQVKFYNENNYEWYGAVNGGLGNAIILCKDGQITASITDGETNYEIYHVEDDIHTIVTLQADKGKLLKCGAENAKYVEEAETTKPISNGRIEPCLDYARVLVLYTANARNAVPNINQTINLCISQFSSAIYNSGITSAAVLELAGSAEINFTESNNILNDVSTLENDITAQNLRNQFQADIVILLTNGTAGSYNSYAGLTGSLEPTNNEAYAIVQVNFATSSTYYTFVHEVGHLYGCRHQNDTDGQPYAHAYSFKPNIFSSWYRTVVHQGMTSGNTILYFSNPNISVHGCPIGVANTNHNARRVTETFPVMMAFRPAPVRPMAVNILGTAYGNAYTYYTWEASTACAINGVSSYEWRRSYDGVNYGSVVGTGEFFSEYLPCPFGNYYYLKVTVRDNANRVSEGFITIYINKGNCGARVEESSPSRLDETASNEPLFSEVSLGDAYPNPFSQTAYIRFALPKEDFVRLEILDIKGRVVQTLVEEKLSAGSHVREFEGKQLSNGIYLYRIWVGNHFTQTKKLSFSK